MQPSSGSTSGSAVDTVLTIPELLHNILQFVPKRTLRNTGSTAPRIKNLTPAIKSLISSSKNLDTLTFSFKEEALRFPAQVLVDLAPHAQHISELNITALDCGHYPYDDNAMSITYHLLVSILEAFLKLSRLAFRQVDFGGGALYYDEILHLQPHLHTFPSVTLTRPMTLAVGIDNFQSPLSIPPGVEFVMTDNGVRLEQFVISAPKDSSTISLATKPAIHVRTRYMKEIMEIGCFSELQGLALDMALDSFWPAESFEPPAMFCFSAVFAESTLVTKLHLGTIMRKQSIRPAVVAELRQLVRMLPCLDELVIDERLPDYTFSQGLGQCAVSSYTDEGHYDGTLES
ncbi:hypothetical protein BGZ81_007469 [Podila clonocystis]|nr:hypothetical protein BGZ81_007469 [Podila clonocystis]